jgi:hypothetical protein
LSLEEIMSVAGSNWTISARKEDPEQGLVASHALSGVNPDQLRDALGYPYEEDDPDLIHSYPIVTDEQAGRFEKLLGMPLQLDVYDYFLDGYADTRPPLQENPSGRIPVRWEVLVFRKDDDNSIFEYELSRPLDEETRASLGPPLDDQGYYVDWLINDPAMASRVNPFLRAPLDLSAPYRYLLTYWDPQRTHPAILAFSKDPEDDPRIIQARYPLRDVTKEVLRSIFGLHEDAPLTGRYALQTEAQAAMLSPFLGQPLDMTAYNYTVDYYSPHESP